MCIMMTVIILVLSVTVAVTIYKSLMLPIIEFGLFLITNKQHIIKLQKIQNKILDYALKLRRCFRHISCILTHDYCPWTSEGFVQ